MHLSCTVLLELQCTAAARSFRLRKRSSSNQHIGSSRGRSSRGSKTHGAGHCTGGLHYPGALGPSGDGRADSGGASTDEAAAAAQRCIEAFASGRLDTILDILPEAVVDRIELMRDRATVSE